jgi:hypothetical protein
MHGHRSTHCCCLSRGAFGRGGTIGLSLLVAGTQELFAKIVQEAEDWVHAGFKSLAGVCPIWSQNNVIM